MRTVLKIILWLFFWPLLLPWWLWKRGWIGKIVASVWVLFLLLVGAALQSNENGVVNQTSQATSTVTVAEVVTQTVELTNTTQITPATIAISTSVATPTLLPTSTSLPTATATLASLPTNTPSPTATSTNTPEATSTPLPTNTSLPPATSTTTPLPTVTHVEDDTFLSTGLGLSKEKWEAQHTQTGSDLLGLIYDNEYIVMFRDNKIWYIERQWSAENAVSPQDVETESNTLIPQDSQLVTVYNPDGRPETTVRLHMSESLNDRFSEDDFIGGEPGNFTVQYNTFDNRVTRMIIALGNNP